MHCTAQHNAGSTNKHDRARLLHLFVYPPAQLHWNKSATSLERQELDAPDGVVDPFAALAALAEMFNDYDGVKFQNATIRHGPDGPLIPHQHNEGMDTIVNRTWELNPNDSSRPTRDGGWILKKMQDCVLKLQRDRTNNCICLIQTPEQGYSQSKRS